MDLIPIESTVDFNLWAVLPTCSQFSAWVALLNSSTFCGTVSINSATIFLIKASSPPDTDCTMERSYNGVFTGGILVWLFKGNSDAAATALLPAPMGEEYFAR